MKQRLYYFLFLFLLSNTPFQTLKAKSNNKISTIPVAAFSSSAEMVCINKLVTLTDQSANTPTSWSWTFNPTTITYKNGTDNHSQNPQIVFKSTGTYHITLAATNADGSHLITKQNYVVGTGALPIVEDFSVVPPLNWAIANPDNVESWEQTTTVGADGAMTQVIRMDNYQYNASGQLDYIVLPKVNLSLITNPQLTFDVAYAAFGPTNAERLYIDYSTDCGENYAVTTYDKSYASLPTTTDQMTGWEPSSAGDWRSETVDITAYSSTETIFRFIQQAGYGNGLFIDNVNITTADAPTADFTSSIEMTCVGQPITLTDKTTNIPTSWTWTFSPNTVTYLNGTNANSQHPQVTFDASGAYDITLSAIAINGTSTVTKKNYVVGTSTFPYMEDFSGGATPIGGVIANPDGVEGWESTTTIGLDGNMSPVTRMDNYQYNAPGQLDYFLLPQLDLSLVTNPKLVFDVAYAAYGANNFERLYIDYSTDCGQNYSVTTYDKSNLDLATVPYQGNGWGPSSVTDWRTDTIDLSAYMSVPTIFRFIQQAGYGNGLFIDNIRIITDDPAGADFASSAEMTCVGHSVTLTDKTINFPTSWSWTFSPNTVTFLNGTTANSQHPQVTFDASGTYDIALLITAASGTSTVAKKNYVVGTDTHPYGEDFTGGVPPNGGVVANPDGVEGWESTTTTGSDGTMTQVIRMDNYQYNAPGQLDYFVLPKMDLTILINPTLTFDVAYAAYGTNNFERLFIEYSTDCGENYNVTTYDKSNLDLATVPYQGNGWGPNLSTHWRTETIDISAYSSTQTIFRFIQQAGYGNGLFIDNIRIEGTLIDVKVSPKIFLEGAYAGGGIMVDNLRANGLIPFTEPYTGLGFTHVKGGGEVTNFSVLNVTGNDAIVDWVFLELRDKNSPATVLQTRSALLQKDGDVVDVDGVSPVSFSAMHSDNYFVAIRHRNHLGVMGQNSLALSTVNSNVDFSSISTYGAAAQKDLGGGIMGLHAGNIDGNSVIRMSGPPFLNDGANMLSFLGSYSNVISNIYSSKDINLDGTVRASGPPFLNDLSILLSYLGSYSTIVNQQLP